MPRLTGNARHAALLAPFTTALLYFAACAPNLSHQVTTNTADIAECRRVAMSNDDKLGVVASELARLHDEKAALQAEVERLGAALAKLEKRYADHTDLLNKLLDSFKRVISTR